MITVHKVGHVFRPWLFLLGTKHFGTLRLPWNAWREVCLFFFLNRIGGTVVPLCRLGRDLVLGRDGRRCAKEE